MNKNSHSNSISNSTIRKTTFTSDRIIIIIGVLSLILIIVYIYNNYKKIISSTVPTGGAIGSTCPDYWDSIGSGKCQNSKKIGSCSKMDGADIMDFSSDVFTNINTGNYAKCKWAKGCSVSWGPIDRAC